MTAIVRMRRILGVSFLLIVARPGHTNLPDNFGGWQTKSFQPIPANLLDRFAGEDALVLHEYGFVSGQRREYKRDDATLTVTLWQMRDPTGSYGLFTFLQQPDMTELEGDDAILAGGGRWLARRGVYVLDARGENLAPDEAPLLLTDVPSLRRGEEVLPQLPAYFPEENLVASSRKFVMGPVALGRLAVPLPPALVGFDLGAEAALARYRTAGNAVRLLLISYATPQLAARQLRRFEEAPAATTDPGTRRSIYMRRQGSLLAIVLDAPQQAAAESLFDGIRYESFITWNEYVPGPRDNVADLLLAAFLLAGFCLLVALVAGISFGGIRYLAKKFLPWAVFDRPSQMEIIRLHIFDK